MGYEEPTQEGTDPQLSGPLSENLDAQFGMGRWAREAVVVAFPLITCGHTIQDDEQRSDFVWVGVGAHLPRRSGEEGSRWDIWVTAVTHAHAQGLDHTDIECADFHHGLGVASACRSRPSLLASADLCRSLEQLDTALKSAALWVEPGDHHTLGYDCH